MFVQKGIVPEGVYSGKAFGEENHNHNEMDALLTNYLKGVLEIEHPTPRWIQGYDAILDVYLGKVLEEFEFNGKNHTPKSFANDVLEINPDDYVEITSYSHHPFYKQFCIEDRYNWSSDLYYNIPFDEFMETMYYAIDNGFSFAWDGDVSEKGFDTGKGIALLDDESITVDQKLRQTTFENHISKIDHVMHITGYAKDQHGKKYFLTKNSWGIRGYEGYLYMSEKYFGLKTIAVMLHKDAIPKNIAKKLGLK